ncbi:MULTISPECIES: hypothetical protein [Streptomyces]|uniref:hypothetical protein n=1 Tax=Streptomyces TaxID=1883 RepID=UPI00177B31EA|nr:MULTISPECIES: hypothetical protein [Streptomyces]GHE39832.1 hypothetical protein GCM10018782_12630 [Streptomyces griseoaurantiacus]MCF0085349.1 hypothetical protein [Streptomyces sp. MH192]MCF0098188.1 hypothetical protein [Streptomyces sp. MH191]MDX3088081.1 hypothetical protein [Streptomyces sp. ME12-02E]MDX3331437.1 hypothetical protein [Streptomyces sp. ME02-6978a]
MLHRIARLVEPLLRLLYPPEGRHRVEPPPPAPVPAPVAAEHPFRPCYFADGPCPGARRRALERRRELWRAEYAAELAAHCAATGLAAELAAGVRR